MKTKKVYLVSLGCPKNLVDSELMLGLLEKAGYRSCEDPQDADLMLVNTCGFIQPAVEEGIEVVLDLVQQRQKSPEKILVVTGCMVQRYGPDLQAELPEVDLFIGTDGFQSIVSRLDALAKGRQEPLIITAPRYLMDSSVPRLVSTPSHRAYIKVTEGCSNRCSYCMIPKLRGPLRSRTLADLVQEAQRLEQQGVRELTLVAQDLTAYGADLAAGTPRLEALLEEFLRCTAIPWIRLLYLYPNRLTDRLLGLMADNPRIVPYLDIPLQHVSSRILSAMRRPYGKESAEVLLGRIRAALPEAAIRSTFIVGFPGEREEDVRELEDFLRCQRLDHVGVFEYSNEEGCAAFDLPDHCAAEEKAERRQRLMEIQAEISLSKNRQRVGGLEPVIVEGVSRESDLLLEGRTRFQAPEIDGCVYIAAGSCNIGDIVPVRITEAHPYDLVGEIESGSES